jgi:hypothetical protein
MTDVNQRDGALVMISSDRTIGAEREILMSAERKSFPPSLAFLELITGEEKRLQWEINPSGRALCYFGFADPSMTPQAIGSPAFPEGALR